jgi:UrcA family protein
MLRTALITLLLLGCGAPALAEDDPRVIQSTDVRIDAGGLDPQDPADAATLLRRIGTAAAAACRMRSPVWPDRGDDYDACRKQFVADAVAAFRSPVLTVHHRRGLFPPAAPLRAEPGRRADRFSGG